VLEYRKSAGFAYLAGHGFEQMVEDYRSHYREGFDSMHGLLIENLLQGVREYFVQSHGQDLQ